MRVRGARTTLILLIATLAACGGGAARTSTVTPVAHAPSNLSPTTGTEAAALEAAMTAPGDSITRDVDVPGSFFLGAAPEGSVGVAAQSAITAALAQPAASGLDEAERRAAVAKLALFSQVAPGATNVPSGADDTPALTWVVLVPRVRELAAGVPSGGAPGPGVTTTTFSPAAHNRLIDVVTLVLWLAVARALLARNRALSRAATPASAP